MVPSFGLPENTPDRRVATAWSTLAPLIAGRPRMRVARDGKNFTARDERTLTAEPPVRPAAVMLYDADAHCRTLALDFDVAKAGSDTMHADILGTHELLGSSGVSYFTDYSPSGGEHFYIPLQQPLPLVRALALVNALSRRFTSLDAGPHRSALSGCIRVPGSTHKTGGTQMLSTPLHVAERIARTGNPETAIAALETELRDDLQALSSTPSSVEPEIDIPSRSAGSMGQALLDTARTGAYDQTRYESPSEARFAVILSAVRSGLSTATITLRMSKGIWPGLKHLYSKYRGASRTKAVMREVSKAEKIIKDEPPTPVRKYTTSQPTTQGGLEQAFTPRSAEEFRYLKTVRNAVHLKELSFSGSREGIQLRLVLRSLVEAGFKVGSRFIEFGARALALACGLEHTTVSRHLRTLRSGPDPFLVLVATAKGTRADQYRLRVPAGLSPAAEAISYRPGKQHALRPAFRVLGPIPALVLEALEHSPGAATELGRRMGLSRSTVYEALATLAAWGLAEQAAGIWKMVPGVNLQLLAEALGADVLVADQARRYAAERRRWRLWLEGRRVGSPALDADYPFELFDPGEMNEAPEFLCTT
jgi:DNA-binding transcriptional ArsR family regulator